MKIGLVNLNTYGGTYYEETYNRKDLAEKYQVASTPTLIFFKNGAEVKRLHGVVKKAELEEAVAEAAEK